MKLPFFYPEHPEFKAHVQYVQGNLLDFHFDAKAKGWVTGQRMARAEDRAKDIVLHITSHRPTWWERLLSRLRGEQTVDMFEAGLEKWLREAVYKAGEGVTMDVMGIGNVYQFRQNLLRELGLDDAREEQS